ncbi:MAG: spore coat associated protein CotJA [Clostridia bacterium]|nr:spore coat associated protein CotJA [Clostridia bacterium]
MNDDKEIRGKCTQGDEGYIHHYTPPAYPSLAMVYSPEQYWGQLYTPEEGLEIGTIFECLNLPFDPMCKEKERKQ